MAALPAPQLTVAQPINDVQLIALVAAQFQASDAYEAVQRAMEIVVEAIVQSDCGRNLPRMVANRQKQTEIDGDV
jgi:hypothetical protein